MAKSTVEQYRVRSRRPPSASWRAFLKNHLPGLVALDFFTVPTVSFKVLFVLIVLAHDRRRILHFNVLAMDAPDRRPVQLPDQGAVVAVPEVGGLHHHYERRAA